MLRPAIAKPESGPVQQVGGDGGSGLAEMHATLIFYEAPHRILDALEAIETVLGPRPVVVARELTKIHEEFLRGTAAEIRAELEIARCHQRRDDAADRQSSGAASR